MCRRDRQARTSAVYAAPGAVEQLAFEGTGMAIVDIEQCELLGLVGPATRAPRNLVRGVRIERRARDVTRCRSMTGDLGARQIGNARHVKPVDVCGVGRRARETR